jgi:hypothetical protein
LLGAAALKLETGLVGHGHNLKSIDCFHRFCKGIGKGTGHSAFSIIYG